MLFCKDSNVMIKKLDDYKLSAVMLIIVNAPCSALTLICAVIVQCVIQILYDEISCNF